MESKETKNQIKNTGLTPDEIVAVQATFSKYPQIQEVILYGSRAMGNYKPASDIDLSLKGEDLNLSLQTQIDFDLDDLLLPYKFDISWYSKINNEKLLDHIDRVGILIYKKG